LCDFEQRLVEQETDYRPGTMSRPGIFVELVDVEATQARYRAMLADER